MRAMRPRNIRPDVSFVSVRAFRGFICEICVICGLLPFVFPTPCAPGKVRGIIKEYAYSRWSTSRPGQAKSAGIPPSRLQPGGSLVSLFAFHVSRFRAVNIDDFRGIPRVFSGQDRGKVRGPFCLRLASLSSFPLHPSPRSRRAPR